MASSWAQVIQASSALKKNPAWSKSIKTRKRRDGYTCLWRKDDACCGDANFYGGTLSAPPASPLCRDVLSGKPQNQQSSTPGNQETRSMEPGKRKQETWRRDCKTRKLNQSKNTNSILPPPSNSEAAIVRVKGLIAFVILNRIGAVIEAYCSPSPLL